MRFNLVSNITNGVGLSQDYAMLRAALEARGHRVEGILYNQPPAGAPQADINIFLELATPQHFVLAREQWLVPNPEWFFGIELLPRFSRVLTKTQDGQQIFKRLARPAVTTFVGWRSRDLYQPELPRQRKFLHLAGKSQFKNTEAVLECWRRYQPAAELVLVGQHYRAQTPGVTCFHRLPDAQLAALMNECQFHLLPAAYEGWGHALHEALGVGAVLITSNAPPMNESPAALLVPTCARRTYNYGVLHKVTPQAVHDAVVRALAMPDDVVAQHRASARAAFLREGEDFERNLDSVLELTN
jgi:hypothetical protein